MARVSEAGRSRRVACEVDVAVAGGGIAGVFAAVSAARQGASTVLIDRFGMPGGNMGPGLINAGGIGPYPDLETGAWAECTHVLGGPSSIPKEFLTRHAEHCGGERNNLLASNAASYLATRMLDDAGVRLMLSTYAGDPIMRKHRVRGLFVENKSGREAVKAKVVIDATGEADVARRAGAPILHPKSEYTDTDHHAPYGAGLWYVLHGINWARFNRVAKSYKATAAEKRWCKRTLGYYYEGFDYLAPCLRKAWKAAGKGTAPFGRDFITGDLCWKPLEGAGRVKASLPKPLGGPGLGYSQTGFIRANMSDGEQVARAEVVARMCIFEMVEFHRAYVPGFEKAHLAIVSPYLGARGGQCIKGEVTLRTEDFVAGRRFDDVAFVFGHVSGGKDVKTGEGTWTDFPYRVMVPRKIDGLIAVGRSASSIPDTLIRGRTKSMHAGEIGGLAAALCAKGNDLPRALDRKRLQKALLKRGYHLGDKARLKELGLR